MEEGLSDLACSGSDYSKSYIENPVTLLRHSEMRGLFAIFTSKIYCCPPIPRTAPEVAKVMLPREILERNESERDFFKILKCKENYRTYWTTQAVGVEIFKEWIKEYVIRAFTKKNPWTGYFIHKINGVEPIGLGTFKPGFIRDEVEIDGFVFAEHIDFYGEVIITLLAAAKHFIGLGHLMNERPVARVVVTVIHASKSGVLEDDRRGTLSIRNRVLRSIFGERSEILGREDPCNCSGYPLNVYRCEASKIEGIVQGWAKVRRL